MVFSADVIRRSGPLEDSADLDRAIAEYEAGMKLDLNDYYPSLNWHALTAPENAAATISRPRFRRPLPKRRANELKHETLPMSG